MAALDLLRDLDRRAYFAALFAPVEKREAFAALGAFHLELRRVAALVNEPLAGEIRLQWWRDVVLGERTSEAQSHPLAAALTVAIIGNQLPCPALERMTEAHVFDLYNDPMPDMPALEGYLGETAATVLQLQCMVLDHANASGAATLCGHVGMALGLANMMNDLPRHLARGRCYIPVDLLQATATDFEALRAGDDAARLRVAAALLATAESHVAAARRDLPALPRTLRPAFLQLHSAERTIGLAARAGSSIFSRPIEADGPKLQFLMAKSALFGF
jgi:15-cis-phytoene synthase